MQDASARRALGRYELIHQLGQGGMGEVYLAKLSGAAGFQKLCIVKTILPALLKEPQFLDRFLHEARVLVNLSHSCIAQVYDMGESEGTWYMALEYVAGVDLAHLQEQARARGQLLPVPAVLYIGQRIAEGLGHAHHKLGPDGAPLSIVHRDVSPHNVMVSYEGEVKVIDFGLAWSAARSRYTLPSTVMGKLGYMSPEQARAEPVDHRTDIYSCGVVLWELLAGRPLIASGTIMEMVAAMSKPVVPQLHTLRPEVDAALDAVVRRALAADPADRYERADDFARALGEQLTRLRTSLPSADQVGRLVRDLCPEAFSQQRELLSSLSSSQRLHRSPPAGAPPPPTTLVAGGPRLTPSSGMEPTALRNADTRVASPPASQPSASPPPERSTPPAPEPARAGSHPLLAALVILLLMAAASGLTALLVRRTPAASPTPSTIIVHVPQPSTPPSPEQETAAAPAAEAPTSDELVASEAVAADAGSLDAGTTPADASVEQVPAEEDPFANLEAPRLLEPEDPQALDGSVAPERPDASIAALEKPDASVALDTPKPVSAPKAPQAPEAKRVTAPARSEPAQRPPPEQSKKKNDSAGKVVELFYQRRALYVSAGSSQGLSVGTVLEVVGPARKGKQPERLGEAEVLEVKPELSRVRLRGKGDLTGPLFAVLPKKPEPAPKAPAPKRR